MPLRKNSPIINNFTIRQSSELDDAALAEIVENGDTPLLDILILFVDATTTLSMALDAAENLLQGESK